MASGTSSDWKTKEATEEIIKSSDEKDKAHDKILENMSKMNLSEPVAKEKYRIAEKELMKKVPEKFFENALVTGDFEARATEGGKVKDRNLIDILNDPVKMLSIINSVKTNSDPLKKFSENIDFSAEDKMKIRNAKSQKDFVEIINQMASRVVDQHANQTKEEVTEKAERIVQQAHLDKMRGVIETRIDDGDQTPVSGQEGIILDQLMINGLDWQPCFSSNWMDLLVLGDFEGMLNFIKDKTAEEIRQLLEQRETKLNYSALHHVIRGLVFVSDQVNSKSKYLECFCKLIDLGANIHARDMIGFSPLLACCFFQNPHEEFLNQTLLKMMKILLKHGADPNAKDRRGNTTLVSPTVALNFEFVKVLLEAGADPTIPNNDGVNVECRPQAEHSTMKRLFAEARKMRTKQMREKAKEEAGGVLKKCNFCGDSSKTTRCTSCYMARYCGKECQNLDWKNHRKLCRQIRDEYVPVKLTIKDDLAVRKRRTGQVKLVEKLQKPAKEHFVVKIQIPIEQTVKIEKKGLVVNDKMMTVVGEIKDDEPVYTALVGKIQAEGVFGQKGFFYGILDEEKNMKINATKILPPELW